MSHEGVFNDDDILLLHDLSRSNNLELRYDSYPAPLDYDASLQILSLKRGFAN